MENKEEVSLEPIYEKLLQLYRNEQSFLFPCSLDVWPKCCDAAHERNRNFRLVNAAQTMYRKCCRNHRDKLVDKLQVLVEGTCSICKCTKQIDLVFTYQICADAPVALKNQLVAVVDDQLGLVPSALIELFLSL